jgi:hypothetical protein
MRNHITNDGAAPPKKIVGKVPQQIGLHTVLLLAGSAFCVTLETPDLQAADQRSDATVKLGALKSPVPAEWQEEIPYDPRGYKAYRLEPASDDEFDANVSIYSLGKQPKDMAARYVALWKQEFLPPQRTSPAVASKLQMFKLRGAHVTYLDIHGDYKGIPGNPTTRRENFRLLGVYLDTPEGAYPIIMFGPADTVGLYRSEFEDWIKAFK